MMIAPFVGLIAVPLIASPLIYLTGHIRAGSARWSGYTALVVIVATSLLLFPTYQNFSVQGVTVFTLGTVSLRFDGVSLLVAALVLLLGALVVIYSSQYIAREASEEKYYALLTAMIGAMIGLACAGDLFNLWIWFEVMTVSSYLLVSFYPGQRPSLEAGVKYLVQSAIGSALILIGIAFVLAQTGALDLLAIREIGKGTPMMLAGGALFVIGFGIKAALVPLHTWLPDAHAQAPSGISAMLSGVVIEAGLVALLRVMTALAGVTLSWGILLMGAGAVNMIVGNLLALRQRQVKRLLAFSSVAQVGYMLLGLGIGLYANSEAGMAGGFFHLLTHGLMKSAAFLAAGALLYALHIAKGEHRPLLVGDLAGAAARYPLPTLALSLAVLGLGGLPPLAGFMSKWQIFAAGFATRDLIVILLVVFAALNSVLSLAYYAPLVNAMYRQKPSYAVEYGCPLPIQMQIPLGVLAAGILAIGIWPDLVRWLTEPAGAALIAVLRR